MPNYLREKCHPFPKPVTTGVHQVIMAWEILSAHSLPKGPDATTGSGTSARAWVLFQVTVRILRQQRHEGPITRTAAGRQGLAPGGLPVRTDHTRDGRRVHNLVAGVALVGHGWAKLEVRADSRPIHYISRVETGFPGLLCKKRKCQLRRAGILTFCPSVCLPAHLI